MRFSHITLLGMLVASSASGPFFASASRPSGRRKNREPESGARDNPPTLRGIAGMHFVPRRAGEERRMNEWRINDEISASSVYLIGFDSQAIGEVSLDEALSIAQTHEVDLVEIVPDHDPPVCKVMDYGKWLLEQRKSEMTTTTTTTTTTTAAPAVDYVEPAFEEIMSPSSTTVEINSAHFIKVRVSGDASLVRFKMVSPSGADWYEDAAVGTARDGTTATNVWTSRAEYHFEHDVTDYRNKPYLLTVITKPSDPDNAGLIHEPVAGFCTGGMVFSDSLNMCVSGG